MNRHCFLDGALQSLAQGASDILTAMSLHFSLRIAAGIGALLLLIRLTRRLRRLTYFEVSANNRALEIQSAQFDWGAAKVLSHRIFHKKEIEGGAKVEIFPEAMRLWGEGHSLDLKMNAPDKATLETNSVSLRGLEFKDESRNVLKDIDPSQRVSITFSASDHLRKVGLRGLVVDALILDGSSNTRIVIDTCIVGKVVVDGPSGASTVSVTAKNSDFGRLIVRSCGLRNLELEACNIGKIESISTDALVRGTLHIDDRCALTEQRIDRGEPIQSLRNLRVSAKDRCDEVTEKLIHAWELRHERKKERGFPHLMNWLYDAVSFYGNRPARAIAVAFALAAVLFLLTFSANVVQVNVSDFSNCTQELIGWQQALCDTELLGNATRSLTWTLQVIVNPFGAVSPKNLVIPSSLAFVIVQPIASIAILVLVAVFALGVRRRFKVS